VLFVHVLRGIPKVLKTERGAAVAILAITATPIGYFLSILKESFKQAGAPEMLPTRLRLLRLVLIACGLIDVLALVVLFLPNQWMADWQTWAGLGPFPQIPITSYLARSSSLMYVAHGLLLLFLSRQVERYLPVIRWLAWIALVHGAILICVGWQADMPWWWICLEGPLLMTWGLVVLWLGKIHVK
jgi:hypothetical protein